MTRQSEIIDEIEESLSPDGRIDTALSVVFLKGQRAYKIKREMKNSFLDYSTLQKRKALCEREFHVNRKNSPELYRTVIFAYRDEAGSIKLWDGGACPLSAPDEYLLEMNRFNEDLLLSKLADKGLLTETLCCSAAGKIAEMHNTAILVTPGDYVKKFIKVVNIINEQFKDSARGIVPEEALQTVPRKLLTAFEKCRKVLAARGAAGFIRECHGDLHLGNICLFNGAPCVFDAVEFNTEFTHIDTLYDLSFLIMDLHHHGLFQMADKVSGSYLVATKTDKKDYLAVMPLYLGLRSIIRCSISAASSRENTSEDSAARLKQDALKYLQETLNFLS